MFSGPRGGQGPGLGSATGLRGSSDITNCVFTPQVISIGPYHHGKNCLAKMERHKSRFLQDFLSRDFGRSLEHHRNKLKKMEQMLRDDYETKFDLTSDQFVDMMILDGCFILELFIKIYNHTRDHEIFKNESLLRYIKTDLLMIENQVPLLVLEILHGNQRKYGVPIPTINQLLAYYFWDMKAARVTACCTPTINSSSFLLLVIKKRY
ncbi:hypothetical protein FCM35_KLT10117 [Carex littledalei]|uniref:Uncharacterized protein n=1 Tax=Carex littledalei TaxID=544730 RepID=A0A833RV69_9POAL|nr:hypothetical protein FCM35_KLT10117 [Carex littledalei]